MSSRTSTKESILYQSIPLFAEKGIAGVTVDDIASAVGIRAPSIYNHYESKQAILGSIYTLFRKHYRPQFLSAEECEAVLRCNNAYDVLNLFRFSLLDKQSVMFDTLRVVFSRRYVDPEAREVCQECVFDPSFQYICQILLKASQLGRIEVDEGSIPSLARTILSTRIFSLSAALAQPISDSWKDLEFEMLSLIIDQIFAVSVAV